MLPYVISILASVFLFLCSFSPLRIKALSFSNAYGMEEAITAWRLAFSIDAVSSKLCDRGNRVSGLMSRWCKVGGGGSDTRLTHSTQFEVKGKGSVINNVRS